MEAASEGRIESVRGSAERGLAEQILAFWSEHGALAEDEGRRRLPEVACVLRGANGNIVGVNSAFPAGLDLIGGRRFWIYRSFLLPEMAGRDAEMINAAFEALQAEYDGEADEPVGLCVPLGDPEEIRSRPEVIWPETELIYAGYLGDGRQARIRYFEDAAIGPALPDSPSLSQMRAAEYPLEERYRILPMEEAEVGPEDVIAFWEREGAVAGQEANRRVHEVHLVAVERDQGVVGASSAYLQRNPQLGMDLWYYRAYVGREHRMSSIAVLLAVRGRELLEERFVSGEDTRGAGVVYEVENDGLKRHFNRALWMPADFVFIGENGRGDHVRVHYFAGARAPVPA